MIASALGALEVIIVGSPPLPQWKAIPCVVIAVRDLAHIAIRPVPESTTVPG